MVAPPFSLIPDMYLCMKINLVCLILIFFFIGCDSKQREPLNAYPTKPVVGMIMVDVHGYKYRLIKLEEKVSETMSQVELWERIEPLITNRWYTPTLSSKQDTNSPVMFNSIIR